MVLVAKAKLYCSSQQDFSEIQTAINTGRRKSGLGDGSSEPLHLWFDNETAAAIRSLEKALRIVCGNKSMALMKMFTNIDSVSYRLAFYYAVLFDLLRRYTETFVSSNPTWIKVAKDDDAKIKKTYKDICKDYLLLLTKMSLLVKNLISTDKTVIHTGDSRRLQLTDQSIDGVITSPPYCTRIDYAIYTRVELALIGYDAKEFESVRNRMIGTPTILPFDILSDPELPLLDDLLKRIKGHETKAAQTYYYKTYMQYFTSMHESIAELNRVLRRRSFVTMVLQDSWFKDVHIDLPLLISEMFRIYGFELASITTEKSTYNMKHINTPSKNYGEHANSESVITMKRG